MKKEIGKTALKWLLFCLILIIPMLAVDYYVDSYASFRITYQKIAETAKESNYYTGQDIQLSERKEKWAIVNEMDRVENMVWGSSRLMLLSSEEAGMDNYYNMSVSGGSSVKDYMAQAYILDLQDKLPDNLLIEISPYIFNANSGEYRFAEWGNAYNFMAKKLQGEDISKDESNLLGVQIKDIISPSYFKYNFEILLEGKRTSFGATENDVEDSVNVWRKDGSFSYSRDFRNAYSEENLLKKTQEIYENKNIYSCDNYTELDGERIAQFENLMDFLTEKGVSISFYLPPYSPEMYEYISSDDYYSLIFEAENWMVNYCNEKGYLLYGSYNPKESGISLADFYDEYHIKEDKIADTMWSRNGQ